MNRFVAWLAASALALVAPLPAYAAFDQEDLVCESTTSTGTGRTTINLSGTACDNYLTFAAGGVADGDTITYTMRSGDGKLETGHAQFNDAVTDTLTNFTVLASSDGLATALNLTGVTAIYLQFNSHSLQGGVGVLAIDSLDVNSITGATSIDVTTESTLEGALDLPDLQGDITLGTQTAGNYAAGDAEAGAALTGDSATAFFSTGTIEDARIDGSAEADEVLNGDKTDFTCTTGSCTLDADVVAPAEMADADHGDFTYSLGAATLDADVVAPAEMADADHGDVSWSLGVASVEGVNANSVTLGTDTVGNYAAGDAEGGAALTGDSATAFFSTGTIEDARIDGSAEADEVLNGDKTDFSCTAGSCTLDADVVAPAEMADADHGDVSWSLGVASVEGVNANSVALGTDTTGGYAASATEGGDATGVAANSVALGGDTTGNYMSDSTAGTGVSVTHTPAEGSSATIGFDYSDAGASPALSSDQCRFTNDTTTPGVLVCEGPTANTAETRLVITEPTADRVFTLPNADSYPIRDNDYGDITVSGSGDTWAVDANSIALGTDTTGNYAAGDAEAGAALTGDSATAFFSTGTIEDARIDGSAEADEVLNGDKTDFSCTAGSCTLDADVVAAAEMADADHGDVSWSAGVASVEGVNANSVALGTDTTGGYAGSATEGGDATGVAANSVALGGDTTGNYMTDTSAGTGVAITHTPAEGSTATIGFDYTDAGASPALAADECRFTNDTTTAGVFVCEGATANAFESRIAITDPTADRLFTLPNADSFAVRDNDYGDITVGSSGESWTVDANSIALGTDTTGNYAAGDAEAGAALTGDSATAFFSTGTIEDARIDGSAEADEVLNGDKTDFTCTTGSCTLDADVVAAAEMADADHGDITWFSGVASIDTATVSVSKLANGTDGELITWNADGEAATVGVGTSGQVLTSNGVGAAPTFQAAAGGLTAVGAQVLTSGTAATYTPTSGTSFWKVTCTGAGGGSGGADQADADDGVAAGGGGEGGGTTISWFNSTEMGATATYTIGTGGTAGGTDCSTACNGGDGGDTTFNPAGTGTTMTAGGGDGGTGAYASGAGADEAGVGGDSEGTATGGDLNLVGGEGCDGLADYSDVAMGGCGGGTYWGPGAKGNGVADVVAQVAGRAGTVYGSGASGAATKNINTTGVAGAAGEDGICLVEEFE